MSAGFEDPDGKLGGGIAATGNYPGKARTPDELRARRGEGACRSFPGTHRFNLHAFYGEFGARRVDRDAIGPEHFAGWIDWAKSLGIGLDFNPTLLLASEGRRQLHAVASRQGDPLVLDPPRRRLPPDRRRDGQGARHAVRDQRVDPRRDEGHAGRSRRPAASG